MKIVFMGTPDFAVPCLEALIDDGHEIKAVFTQPDKPKGRGYKLTPPPVKELALQNEIPVFQPTTLKDEEVLKLLESFEAEIFVVVAYGKILPKKILDLPKYGCVNVHASLLPKYRGAGPIQWSILNGETETGVTTMYMAEGIDTGDILEKKSILIGENETADELHDRLSLLGAELIVSTVNKLYKGEITPIKQDDSLSTHAPMLSKEMSLIDFNKSAKEVHNLIRGLSSWPCAHTFYNGMRLKIYKSEIVDKKGAPGELLDDKHFVIACGDKAIKAITVQYEGSKKMPAEDFLRGKSLKMGEIFR